MQRGHQTGIDLILILVDYLILPDSYFIFLEYFCFVIHFLLLKLSLNNIMGSVFIFFLFSILKWNRFLFCSRNLNISLLFQIFIQFKCCASLCIGHCKWKDWQSQWEWKERNKHFPYPLLTNFSFHDSESFWQYVCVCMFVCIWRVSFGIKSFH